MKSDDQIKSDNGLKSDNEIILKVTITSKKAMK